MVAPDIRPEGPDSEWKERVPRPERLAKTFAAFANGGGGTLWIGVSDNGQRRGVADEAAARRGLAAALALVDPAPRAEVRKHLIDGALLLEVVVADGAEKPFAVVRPGGERVVYIRDGSSSRRAGERAVRALARPPARKAKLGEKERKLLGLLAARDGLTLGELARAARLGQRTARRLLVPLLQAGLVHEKDGRRFALTPQGHRRLG